MNALDLIRSPEVDFPALMAAFGASEAFVAGLVDAVTGDTDWTLHVEGAIPQSERDDYEAGRAHGRDLMDEANDAEGWAECYGLERAVEMAAVGDNDLPF